VGVELVTTQRSALEMIKGGYHLRTLVDAGYWYLQNNEEVVIPVMRCVVMALLARGLVYRDGDKTGKRWHEYVLVEGALQPYIKRNRFAFRCGIEQTTD